MSNGDEVSGCLWQGVSVCPKPEAAPVPCSALPGVVETVPLAGDGILAVGSVVSPHGGARVVGDGIEVVNGVVCGEQEGCSAVLAAARVPPACQHRAAARRDRHNGCLWFPPPCFCPYHGLQHSGGCEEHSQETPALTAALGGKLPEVQVLQLEVNKGGELARSYPGL